MLRLSLLFLIALPIFAAPAEAASAEGNVVIQNWKRMDICARQAQTAHPAFTAQENAERQAALDRCLEQNDLPPRQSASPPQPH